MAQRWLSACDVEDQVDPEQEDPGEGNGGPLLYSYIEVHGQKT